MVRLKPCVLAPSVARKLVRATCGGGVVPASVVEDAALIVGVLIAHSVRQAHSTILLTVQVDPLTVLVAFEDDSSVLPMSIGAGGGYGLMTVTRLAERSGFTRTSNGRRGWALLTRSAAPAERSRPWYGEAA